MSKEDLASNVNAYLDALKYLPKEDVRDIFIDFLSDLKEFLTQKED